MELLTTDNLAYIGIATLVLLSLLILGLILVVGITYVFFRNNRVVSLLSSKFNALSLKILLLFIDLLYVPAKKIISLLGGNEMMLDIVITEMRNILFKKNYSHTPFNERVVILPQCLRSTECPASFSSVDGAQCIGCGKCKIFKITKKADELGYKGTYIAPGGGYVKRIIKKVMPKAVLGVGCPHEVSWGMSELLDINIPCQGVVLLKSGCVNTDVDLGLVFEALEIKI